MTILPTAFLWRHKRLSTQNDNEEDTDSKVLKRTESTSSYMQQRRNIYVNMEPPNSENGETSQNHHYCSNRIRTSKYTVISFIPKNLFEQFRNVANLYFLFLVILERIPTFGGSEPAKSTLPLAAILIITGIKDSFEDWKRNQSDRRVNQATTRTLLNWRNVNTPVVTRGAWYYLYVFLGFFCSLVGLENKYTRHYRTKNITGQSQHSKNHNSDSITTDIPLSTIHPQKSSLETLEDQVIHESRSTRFGLSTEWKKTLWQDLQVGDYVKIQNNEDVPADMVILASSGPDRLCYIETQNLDGETNLKVRQGLEGTVDIRTGQDCKQASFYIQSEPPHVNIYQYSAVMRRPIDPNDSGTMQSGISHKNSDTITYNNIILRGCVLRNTDWIIGMVVYTGNDTKIMLNSGETPSKRSKIAKETNPHVIANFVILAVICILNAIIGSIQFNASGSSRSFDYNIEGTNAAWSGFVTFWVALILYQTIVPISLYISIDLVKSVAAYFIHSDIDLYHEETDTPCIPKTWNISDDLGQIEYVFSDKTGTLTQNVMEYRKCTINGISYGCGKPEAQKYVSKRPKGTTKLTSDGFVDLDRNDHESRVSGKSHQDDGTDFVDLQTEMFEKQASLYKNPHIGLDPTFVDPKLFDDLAKADSHAQAIQYFFLTLALCHTVISERPDPDNPDLIEYKAESPDEAALVATARDLGFVFLGRQGNTIHAEIMGERKSFDLLNTLEFNSTRKRMSVIIKPQDNGRRVLLCKGADSIIYERLCHDFGDQVDLKAAQLGLQETCSAHLEDYANQGLRTLCLAYRFIDDAEYGPWEQRYQEASSSIMNREEHVETVSEDIEKDLLLMGGTAIEDRLQDGVPETIAELAKSGIKLWVLTGDKTETAINIGFSCNLLTPEMELLVLKANTREETKDQLITALEKATSGDNQHKNNLALVIDGTTLKYGLEPGLKEMVLTLGTHCKSVICCRVSPKQKAQVVNMVKKGLKVMTLAIGDGANDVSMIQEANIGVGISGVEGRQAVMASDYAIAQFRFLRKLLLVHGRWSYLRISEMIRGFFVKNIIWTFTLFWYQIFCQFNGSMMFEESLLTLYNLIFTSLPIAFLGVWDQDLDSETTLRYPELYRMGIRNDNFKTWQFWLAIMDSIYQSAVCFFIPYIVLVAGGVDPSGHDVNGVYEMNTIVSGIAVCVANFYVAMSLHSFTWIQVFIIALSILIYFLFIGVYSQFNDIIFGGQTRLFGIGIYWLVFLLTIVAAFTPRLVMTFYLHQYHPRDNDIVREIELVHQRKQCGSPREE